MAKNQPLNVRSDSEVLRKYVLCSNARCANRLSREVRLLPCLHLCCERCLNAVVNRGEDEEVGGVKIPEENYFPCPKEGCERKIQHDYLQQNERAQLHRWLGELVQNLQARDTLVRGEEPLCSECEKRPAVAVCRRCFDTRLCGYCERYHRDNVKTRDHAGEIIAIERLVEQLNDDPPRGLRTNYAKPLRCSVHGRRLRFYCKRTGELVCTSGMLTYHRPNCSRDQCKAVEDFIHDPDHLPKIVGLKEAVDMKCAELQHAVDEVEAIQRDLLQRKEDVEGEIEARKRELVRELERQEAELKQQVETICNAKLRRLNEHSETLTQIKEEIERSAQFVTDFIDNYGPAPVEFFLLKDHIQPALEEILRAYESHDFNCREDATLNYDPHHGPRQVGTMGSVSSSPDTENFMKNGPDIELRAAEVLHFGITCRDAAGGTPIIDENMPFLRARLVPNEDDLGAQPGSQDHPDAVDCLVTRHCATGKYSISVFPPSRGPHCLWVYEDCPQPTGVRHIRGSPFEVEVQEPKHPPFPIWFFI